MKAWQNPQGVIRDVAQGDPDKNYHPAVAAFYTTKVPDGIVNGATLVSGVWTNPPPPPAPVPPTAAEIAAVSAAAKAAKAAQVRSERKHKLEASDWTQLIDAPVDQATWATYRQELRDISLQAGFPSTSAWPVQP